MLVEVFFSQLPFRCFLASLSVPPVGWAGQVRYHSCYNSLFSRTTTAKYPSHQNTNKQMNRRLRKTDRQRQKGTQDLSFIFSSARLGSARLSSAQLGSAWLGLARLGSALWLGSAAQENNLGLRDNLSR